MFCQDAILKHTEAGTTDSPEYKAAAAVFYKKHVCRLDAWPAEVLESFGWMQKDPTIQSALYVPLPADRA